MSAFDKPIKPESNCFCWSSSQDQYDASFVPQRDAWNQVQNRNNNTHENDLLLSEAFQNLTFEERAEQEEVLHGVDKDIPETEDFVENALQELESHLNRQKKLGSAYELAEQMNSDYVHARPLRIMFLRSCRYDTKATAERMLKFFELKKKIFGPEKLTKDITTDDLYPDEISALKSGMSQFCGRDRSGRMIIVNIPSVIPFKSAISEMRARYFFFMDALRSEQTQLRGFVFITYSVAEYRNYSNGENTFPETVDAALTCPIFVAAVHFCCDDLKEYYVGNLVLKIMPEKLRTRLRLHYGSHLECQYRLSTFGIHRDQLPFYPITFSINKEKHLQWYESRFGENLNSIAAPPCQTKQASCIEPNPNDVLYMYGTRRDNGGNIHFRKLVVEWSFIYGSGKNETKRRVVNEIISEIHSTGGRFLDKKANRSKVQDDVWTEIPIGEVRLKIAQAFRNHRRKVTGCRKKGN